MTSVGLGEMFEGYSADTCAGKFPLMSMGGRAIVKRAQMSSEGPHRRERKLIKVTYHRTNIFLIILVILKAGDVPVISVLDRKWNDDSIAAKLELKLQQEVMHTLPYIISNISL